MSCDAPLKNDIGMWCWSCESESTINGLTEGKKTPSNLLASRLYQNFYTFKFFFLLLLGSYRSEWKGQVIV